MRPLLSIVIVNSDGTADTLRCLQSIQQYPPDVVALTAHRHNLLPTYEIIVVDNRSRDNFPELLRRQFPDVRTLIAPERQGFAKNYNQGIREASGEYVLILNNDTLMHPEALTKLLTLLIEDPAYGMVGPRLVSVHGRIQTDSARSFPTPLTYLFTQLLLDPGLPFGKTWQRYEQQRLATRQTGRVACISGACMLVSRTTLESAGLLDEGFDFYYEDVEWCHRIQRHGRAIGYSADSQITHLGDQSLSKVKVWAKQSEYRSALKYFRQYYRIGPIMTFLTWLVTTLSFFLRGVFFLGQEIVTQQPSHARAYLYLWQWMLQQTQRSL